MKSEYGIVSGFFLLIISIVIGYYTFFFEYSSIDLVILEQTTPEWQYALYFITIIALLVLGIIGLRYLIKNREIDFKTEERDVTKLIPNKNILDRVTKPKKKDL